MTVNASGAEAKVSSKLSIRQEMYSTACSGSAFQDQEKSRLLFNQFNSKVKWVNVSPSKPLPCASDYSLEAEQERLTVYFLAAM